MPGQILGTNPSYVQLRSRQISEEVKPLAHRPLPAHSLPTAANYKHLLDKVWTKSGQNLDKKLNNCKNIEASYKRLRM